MFATAAMPGLTQPLRQELVLLWCVLASIALHALVFLGFSGLDVSAPQAKAILVLTARLAPIATAPSEPSPHPQVAPLPAPKTPPEPRPATEKQAIAPARSTPMTAPAATARAAPAESAAPAAAASSPQTGAPSQATAAPQAPVAATTEAKAKSGSEADTGTLEKYRHDLIEATKRYKRYPAIAMERGWQGRVEVRMVIGANGMLASASVKTSSGYEVLDKQAVDMLRKGKTTLPIPAALRGREFSVDVPVTFNLDNPNA